MTNQRPIPRTWPDVAITPKQRLTLESLDTDLTEIALNLKWAYFDGYQPTRPTDRGTSTNDDGTDVVAGRKFDIGLGNMRSRDAFTTAMRHLGVAEVRIALSMMHLAGTDPHMPLVKPQHAKDLDTGLKCIELMRVRLARIIWVYQDRSQRMVAHNSWPAEVVGHLIGANCPSSAYAALQACRAALYAALPQPDEPKRLMCAICGMRPASPKAAGCRCTTCYKYLRRTGGERPTGVERNPNREALRAKARREAAGLGFGHG